LGKTIKAFGQLKVQALQKSKNFHAKTQSRKEKLYGFPGLRQGRLCVFASLRALLIFFWVVARPRWDSCFALNGIALIF